MFYSSHFGFGRWIQNTCIQYLQQLWIGNIEAINSLGRFMLLIRKNFSPEWRGLNLLNWTNRSLFNNDWWHFLTHRVCVYMMAHVALTTARALYCIRECSFAIRSVAFEEGLHNWLDANADVDDQLALLLTHPLTIISTNSIFYRGAVHSANFSSKCGFHVYPDASMSSSPCSGRVGCLCSHRGKLVTSLVGCHFVPTFHLASPQKLESLSAKKSRNY